MFDILLAVAEVAVWTLLTAFTAVVAIQGVTSWAASDWDDAIRLTRWHWVLKTFLHGEFTSLAYGALVSLFEL